MKIYIDKDFICHTTMAEGREEQECSFFDKKSKRFIEGYRYIPNGRTWTREDGAKFYGEMITPIEDSKMLKIYEILNDEKTLDTKTKKANDKQLQLLEDCIVELANIVYGEEKP